MLKKVLSLSFIFLISANTAFAANGTPKTNLESYFTNSQIKSMQDYKAGFEKISSAKDLALIYKKSQVLAKSLNDKIGNIESPDLEKYKWMNKYVPGLELIYGSEALSMYFDNNFQTFLSKAKKTTETSDDTFLNLMIDSYGDLGNAHANWFMMTWDLGGYTLLGKGVHTKTLDKINNALIKSPEFTKEIKEVREQLINDILNSNNFAVPKVAVIKEINQIISNKSITPTEKIKLQNRIKQLNKPTKDMPMQFNCEKAQCAYG